MKVLVVTGGLMEERVKEIVEKHGWDVFAAPVEIAAFLRTEHLTKIRGYDLILVPGYSKADLAAVEKVTGIKTAKGPKDVANLEPVLENIHALNLSKATPACELLKEKLKKKALQEVKRVDALAVKKRLLKKPWNIMIGKIAIGRDFPMRILAEIVDADKMTEKEVIERARYYIEQGADIIDIGISGKAPVRVRKLIKVLKSLNVPLSVDTMEYENILAAIDSKVDLILSLDRGLIDRLPPTDIPIVVIPGAKKFKTAEEKVAALQENIEFAKSRGFKKVIADPILEPINYGFSDSIAAYREFGKRNEAPVLMGAGNVTELTDADSIGINATLAGIAMECGVDILFTTEASDKTKGSVKELKTASYMMFLSKNRKTAPKDLGIDLLIFKEKRRSAKEIPVKTKKVTARGGPPARDPSGDFTIIVDRSIIAVHSQDGIADVAVEGNNAKDICDTILQMGLISELAHALYLGRELEKAELALSIGRSYIQDAPLFESPL